MRYGAPRRRTATWPTAREMLGRDLTDDMRLDDVPSGEAEELEAEVADAATAARTDRRARRGDSPSSPTW